SLNIAKTMDGGNLSATVDTAVRALTAVSDMTTMASVPSVVRGNEASHAIGLGQMNLHGYLARERIHYGSPEGIDFTNMYFYAVAYHAIAASNQLAIERGETFFEFDKSAYADGSFFDKYIDQEWAPATDRVRQLFADAGIDLPGREDWVRLRASVME